jgi:hypothetical protein
MGLLDDAIREHLELKRLRGAAATEVAREEQEVFGTGRSEVEETPEDDLGGPDSDALRHEALSDDAVAVKSDAERSGELDLPHVGQETAELDMRSVLEPEPAAAESLEWEVPGDSDDDGPAGSQGAHGSPADESSGHDRPEPAEDVLEETPDFLRETPEQDRLWFEQQPPRDFDFDK